jgi:hypothetical protein
VCKRDTNTPSDEQVLERNSGNLLDLDDHGVSKNQLSSEVPEGLWALPSAEIIDPEATSSQAASATVSGRSGRAPI